MLASAVCGSMFYKNHELFFSFATVYQGCHFVSRSWNQANQPNQEEKTQLRAHLGMLNQPKLARTAKWGDFLDDMMNKYPLRHRINLDAQQMLAQRIIKAKKQSTAKSKAKSKEKKVCVKKPKSELISKVERQPKPNSKAGPFQAVFVRVRCSV